MNIYKTSALVAGVLVFAASASAIEITLGTLSFSGTFETNPYYSFNDPAQWEPYGEFFDLHVTSADGIFASCSGELSQSTSWLFGNDQSGHPSEPMLWSIGDFSFATTHVWLVGPVGVFCQGSLAITGPNLPPNAHSQWNFIAPDHNHFTDVTGPISMSLIASFDDGVPAHVPDSGSTALLAAVALAGLISLKPVLHQ